MDILLTSAGRRNYLLEYFRDSLAGGGRVMATDCCPEAACLQEADAGFVVPPVREGDYIDHLLTLCLTEGVGMVISLNDHELPILATHRQRFREVGIEVVVSSPKVISLASDKVATARFAEGLGIGVPVTFTSLEEALLSLDCGEVGFPLVVKPRWGTASLGVEVVEDREELRLAWQLGIRRLPTLSLPGGGSREDSLMIQSRLVGQEYGLDVVNDLQGRYQATFVKRKLAMRAGETDRAVTESSLQLLELGRCLGEALGHVGNLDCDVFMDGDKCYLLEINPRFGGGYPFSHVAGARVPSALIAWAQGKEAPQGWADVRPGVVSSKCDRLVVMVDRWFRSVKEPATLV